MWLGSGPPLPIGCRRWGPLPAHGGGWNKSSCRLREAPRGCPAQATLRRTLAHRASTPRPRRPGEPRSAQVCPLLSLPSPPSRALNLSQFISFLLSVTLSTSVSISSSESLLVLVHPRLPTRVGSGISGRELLAVRSLLLGCRSRHPEPPAPRSQEDPRAGFCRSCFRESRPMPLVLTPVSEPWQALIRLKRAQRLNRWFPNLQAPLCTQSREISQEPNFSQSLVLASNGVARRWSR